MPKILNSIGVSLLFAFSLGIAQPMQAASKKGAVPLPIAILKTEKKSGSQRSMTKKEQAALHAKNRKTFDQMVLKMKAAEEKIQKQIEAKKTKKPTGKKTSHSSSIQSSKNL